MGKGALENSCGARAWGVKSCGKIGAWKGEEARLGDPMHS